jgi:predicted transcriptional regulator
MAQPKCYDRPLKTVTLAVNRETDLSNLARSLSPDRVTRFLIVESEERPVRCLEEDEVVNAVMNGHLYDKVCDIL